MSASRKLRPWASLTPDLLLDVSGRLHDGADFVRFHAVCTSWRDLHSTATRPKFLPWILTHRNSQIVHSPVIYYGLVDSSSETTASYHGNCNEVTLASAASPAHDRNWVGSADGTTAWLFTESPAPRLVNLLTRTFMPLPRFADNENGTVMPPPGFPPIDSKWLMRNPHGMVYNDGTVFLYTFTNSDSDRSHLFRAAIRRPGDDAWVVIRYTLREHAGQNSCAAYHDRNVLVWTAVEQWCVLSLDFEEKGSFHNVAHIKWIKTLQDSYEDERYVRDRCYVLESRGELLRVSVLVKRGLAFYPAVSSVLVHALEGAWGETRWVARDGRSFADRVLFLGSKASFAADAAQLGMCGGCAYLVFSGSVYRCGLLVDGEPKFVKLLPSGGGTNGWLRPQPDISPIEKIREKLEAQSKQEDGRNQLNE